MAIAMVYPNAIERGAMLSRKIEPSIQNYYFLEILVKYIIQNGLYIYNT